MSQLKRFVCSAHNPIAQVAKRLQEHKQHNQSDPSFSRNYTAISTKLKDSCFLLSNSKYAFVKEKQGESLLCDVISNRHTESFFGTPADSKIFDIVLVRKVEERAKRYQINSNQIVHKAVCLPYKDGYVIFPLRHEVERC